MLIFKIYFCLIPISFIILYGLNFNYFQTKFKSTNEYKQDLKFSIVWSGAASIVWPFSIIFLLGFYFTDNIKLGFKFW